MKLVKKTITIVIKFNRNRQHGLGDTCIHVIHCVKTFLNKQQMIVTTTTTDLIRN